MCGRSLKADHRSSRERTAATLPAVQTPQPGTDGRPNDPSGILNRIPELEALAHDSRIRRAIEAGKPHAIYRALFWANLLGRSGAHAETARTLHLSVCAC